MKNIKNYEEFERFEDNFLVEMLDLYNDINDYCKENAFDILNTNNYNKNTDFIDLIFNNTITPIEEELDEDSNDEEFIYV